MDIGLERGRPDCRTCPRRQTDVWEKDRNSDVAGYFSPLACDESVMIARLEELPRSSSRRRRDKRGNGEHPERA
jgi:hypothetical protein